MKTISGKHALGRHGGALCSAGESPIREQCGVATGSSEVVEGRWD